MDTSQIAKNIWSGGVSMTLYDIQWIGDNNMGSGDTAVGNNYNAKALYSGTYSVKIPTAYTAKVTYTGTAEKEISEQTAYTLTYLGEKAEMQVMEEENHYLPFFIGGGCVLLLLAGGTIYYLMKRRKIETVPSDLDGLEAVSYTHLDVYKRQVSGGVVTSVVFSETGYGHHIRVDCGNGVQVLYAHCSDIFVTKGQSIAAGQVIAEVGATGRVTGAHLHLGVLVLSLIHI